MGKFCHFGPQVADSDARAAAAVVVIAHSAVIWFYRVKAAKAK